MLRSEVAKNMFKVRSGYSAVPLADLHNRADKATGSGNFGRRKPPVPLTGLEMTDAEAAEEFGIGRRWKKRGDSDC